MRIAIVGSRSLTVDNLEAYLPSGVTEIVSGGAQGIDTSAREYAKRHGLTMIEVFPDYETYGKRAPLIRNDKIVDLADEVYAFWDGTSHGTKYVIDYCKRIHKKVTVLVKNK